jgi:hypothetical protein
MYFANFGPYFHSESMFGSSIGLESFLRWVENLSDIRMKSIAVRELSGRGKGIVSTTEIKVSRAERSATVDKECMANRIQKGEVLLSASMSALLFVHPDPLVQDGQTNPSVQGRLAKVLLDRSSLPGSDPRSLKLWDAIMPSREDLVDCMPAFWSQDLQDCLPWSAKCT